MRLKIERMIYDEGLDNLFGIIAINEGYLYNEERFGESLFIRTFVEGPAAGRVYLIGIRNLGHMPDFDELEKIGFSFHFAIDAPDLDLHGACGLEFIQTAYQKYITGEGPRVVVDFGYNALQDFMRERLPEAAEKFFMAFTVGDSHDSLLPLSEVLWKIGRENDALRVLHNFNCYYPENARGWCVLGNFMMKRGDATSAERAYETARRIDSGFPGPFVRPVICNSFVAA